MSTQDKPREFILSKKVSRTIASDYDCLEIEPSRDHSNMDKESRLLHLSGIHVIEYSAFQKAVNSLAELRRKVEAYAEAGCIEAYTHLGESLSDVVESAGETLKELGVLE